MKRKESREKGKRKKREKEEKEKKKEKKEERKKKGKKKRKGVVYNGLIVKPPLRVHVCPSASAVNSYR